MAYEKELAFAKELASEAGKIMLKYFRADNIGTVEKAYDRTLVTKADTEINSMVIERVKQNFPGHAVHGEEEGLHVEGAAYTWVCDPVDGTMPFAKGIPISTFSLAFVDEQGRAVFGVVYDPFQDRLFEAVRGSGALMNGSAIHVSDKSELDNAYVDQAMWINVGEGVSFDDPRDLLNKAGAKVTALCSAVIAGCLVASGAYDAMFFAHPKPEDIAALSVIVEEAGGKVTDFKGRDQRYDTTIYGAIVSNGHIHADLVELLSKINYKNESAAA